MPLFYLALRKDMGIGFWKLMGSGINGRYNVIPNLRQWAILYTTAMYGDQSAIDNPFIKKYLRFFRAKTITYVLEPMAGHGKWDEQACFGHLPPHAEIEGTVAVLTRASIRIKKLFRFWQHVPQAMAAMQQSPGHQKAYGIGEIPWIRQATFSVWDNQDAMKAFAYNSPEHAAIIRKTRDENWYSEEMFVRFRVLACYVLVRP
jgi:hypothetical protein